MKKFVWASLFSTSILLTVAPISTYAEVVQVVEPEVTEVVVGEEPEQENTDSVVTISEPEANTESQKLATSLGEISIVAEGRNTEEDDSELNFSVPRPKELEGLKVGEATIGDYIYNPEISPSCIGTIVLEYSPKEGVFDSKMYYGVYDDGTELQFIYGSGNMNIVHGNDPSMSLSPYLSGEEVVKTPNGSYNLFAKLIFTNIPQELEPSHPIEKPEQGENTGNTEAPEQGENTGNTEAPEQGENTGNTEAPEQSENTGNTGNTETNNESQNSEKPAPGSNAETAKNNEQQFVENTKENGDASEVYASNDKLPQTSQTSKVLSGLLVMTLGIATGVYAKFRR